MPTDRLVALSIAALRGVCSTRPQRPPPRSEILWLPIRWQFADMLTQPGLETIISVRLASGFPKLHEILAQQ